MTTPTNFLGHPLKPAVLRLGGRLLAARCRQPNEQSAAVDAAPLPRDLRRAAAFGYGVRCSGRACLASVRCEREHSICGGPRLAGHDCPGVRRRQWSARTRSSEGQVDGLLEAERHALGVGPL